MEKNQRSCDNNMYYASYGAFVPYHTSIVQCFVDMAEWIKFALAMAVNIVVGLVCGFLLKCCFHRRRFIRVTVVAYWITYVIATVVIDIGESKNIFELLIILLLVMFFSACFSLKKDFSY